MDRTERLLDLVALLLDSPEPVSWAELKEAFPEDYARGSEEATERKFERDKAELLELGIPLLYVQGDEDRRDGYVLHRDAYYLPQIDFTPEELAVLYSAGAAVLASDAFPGQHDLAHALRKIGFLADAQLPLPRFRMELGALEPGPQLKSHLETLWSAAAARKKVQLTYLSPRSADRSTERTVRPYGLALRRGTWSLVGFCELRQELRTFHVHRIHALMVNPLKPRSPDFDVPADFRLDEHVAQHPWQQRIHAPLDATVQLSGELAPLAARLFPGGQVEAEESQTQVTLSVTYLDGLLRAALSLAPNAKMVAPADAVARFQAMAERVLGKHVGKAAA